MRTTPKKVVLRTRSGCRRRFIGQYEVSDGLLVYVFAAGCSGSLPYFSQIGFAKPMRGMSSQAVVHCTCPMFTYYLEYACARQGASFFHNALPLYPKIRNPRARCYLCKHLIYVLEPAMKKITRYQSQMTARLASDRVKAKTRKTGRRMSRITGKRR